MPQSPEHSQCAGLLLSCIENAIREDLLGLSPGEEDPHAVRFNRGGRKQPFWKYFPLTVGTSLATDNEPDVVIYLRGRPPFIVGEVGVSDSETVTKLRAQKWIDDGNGDVWIISGSVFWTCRSSFHLDWKDLRRRVILLILFERDYLCTVRRKDLLRREWLLKECMVLSQSWSRIWYLIFIGTTYQ